jgi:L-aspartate oxidase
VIDRPVTTIRSSRPIVIGSGIAGLTTALSLDGATVITASKVGRGSSWLAQGGLAAAIGRDDDPRHHAFDTLRVGGAIAVPELAEALAVEAPGRVGWLESIGAEFDEGSDGTLVLGREAGHSHRRIVHAGGDATGAEIMRALRTATVLRSDIEIVADTRLVDLIRNGDRIVGALVASTSGAVTAYIAPRRAASGVSMREAPTPRM